jgi:hypothetical protein
MTCKRLSYQVVTVLVERWLASGLCPKRSWMFPATAPSGRVRQDGLNNSIFDKLDDSFDTVLRASILNVTVMTFTDQECEQGRCSNHSFNTSFPWLDSVNIVATACSFYLCIRDYRGSVRDTIFTEDVIRDIPILQPRGSTHPYANFHTSILLVSLTATHTP